MNDIYVAGVGMTPFGRLLDRGVYGIVSEAVALALKDAGAEAADIGSVFYATLTNGQFQGADRQVMLRRHLRSFDLQEGLQAFAEKRAPQFQGR